MLNARRLDIFEHTTALRLPAIYQWPESAEEGGCEKGEGARNAVRRLWAATMAAAQSSADDAMERGATRARPVEGERTCGCGEEAGRSGHYSEIERREAIARERADQQVVCSVSWDAYGAHLRLARDRCRDRDLGRHK